MKQLSSDAAPLGPAYIAVGRNFNADRILFPYFRFIFLYTLSLTASLYFFPKYDSPSLVFTRRSPFIAFTSNKRSRRIGSNNIQYAHSAGSVVESRDAPINVQSA